MDLLPLARKSIWWQPRITLCEINAGRLLKNSELRFFVDQHAVRTGYIDGDQMTWVQAIAAPSGSIGCRA